MKTFLPKELNGNQTALIAINLILLCYVLSPSYSDKIIEREEDLKYYIPVENAVQEMRIATPIPSGNPHTSKKSKLTLATYHKKQIEINKIVTDATVLNFLCTNDFIQRAYTAHKETGLLVSTIIAQKGIESNWGKSGLTKRTKNLSNIKCTRKSCKRYNIKVRKGQIGSSTDHCVQLYDDKPSDRFVKLQTNWQGWNQYKALLKSKRFKSVGEKKTLSAQVKELKLKGWATQSNYATILTNAAQKYNLIKLQEYIDDGYDITAGNGKYIILKQ